MMAQETEILSPARETCTKSLLWQALEECIRGWGSLYHSNIFKRDCKLLVLITLKLLKLLDKVFSCR